MSGSSWTAGPEEQPTPGRTLSDEEVVGRVRAGEVALYEILMRRHNRRLYRAVRAVLRDESEVEDIVQDAYLAAYRSLGDFRGRASFSTWLTRIAVNRAIDQRRRRARVVVFDPQEEESRVQDEETWGVLAEDPERRSARRELTDLLEAAIDELPDFLRGVYVLREVEGLSTREAAESLGIEPGTLKTRLHRARTLLRERLVRELDVTAAEAFPFGGPRCDRIVATVLDRLEREPR